MRRTHKELKSNRRMEERKSQRDLKNAVRHFFGPEGDLSPSQIARMRGQE
jgi:hypothetical protein